MTQKEKIVQYLEKKYPIILKRNEAKKELMVCGKTYNRLLGKKAELEYVSHEAVAEALCKLR